MLYILETLHGEINVRRIVIILSLASLFLSCDNSTEPNSNNTTEYFEDFEQELLFESPISNSDGSFISYGSNGWNSFYEKVFEEYNVSTSWKWEKVKDSNSGSYSIRGKTSIEAMGGLWLFKKFEIKENENINISVFARTEKIHNGVLTGPGLYVFEGDVLNPSLDHPNLLGRDYYQWGYSFWSDWRKLDTIVKSNKNIITIGFIVRDGWNRYLIYHEFDNLRISLK